MNQQKYDNSGVLFKNNKDGNERRPDYRGSLVVNGADYNISAWIRASQKTGDKFLSLKIESKTEWQKGRDRSGPKRAEVSAPSKPQLSEDNWDDLDQPF